MGSLLGRLGETSVVRRVPGDLILHPLVLASIGVLLVNDHVLKDLRPGSFTGKLSDFAGLAFFPVFLVGVFESARWVLRKQPWIATPTTALICSTLTTVVFVAVKTWGPTADLYRHVISWLQLPLFGSGPLNHTQDPTDLIALPATALVVLIVTRSAHRGPMAT